MLVLAPDAVWTEEGLCTGLGVAMDAGVIVDLIPLERYPGMVQRLQGRALLPGLVNAHSHAFQRALRGHVQWKPSAEDDFWSWRNRMYKVANELDPEQIAAVSQLAFLEMVEGGVTAVGEFHYIQHQAGGRPYADPDEIAARVIEAARAVGLRIALLRVGYARAGRGQALRPEQQRFGDVSADAVLQACGRLADRYSADSGVRIGLAPHSVRAVPASWLSEFAQYPGVVHAHVAEQPAEVEACQAEYGMSPLSVFAEQGLVTERFTAVHLTWPSAGDVETIVGADASVCACPSTELDLGDGWLPLEVRAARLCLGSDSHARIDLFEEARALEWHARALSGHRVMMAPPGDHDMLPARLLQAASGSGARALGFGAHGIAKGRPADVIAVDISRPASLGMQPLKAVAFTADAGFVTDSWVAGRQLLDEGRHPLRVEVMRRAQAVLAQL